MLGEFTSFQMLMMTWLAVTRMIHVMTRACLTFRTSPLLHLRRLTHAQTIRWTVQAVQAGMIGPQSVSTIFHIPDTDSGEIDSAHAWVSLQEGTIVESQNYPLITQDTFLDGELTCSAR